MQKHGIRMSWLATLILLFVANSVHAKVYWLPDYMHKDGSRANDYSDNKQDHYEPACAAYGWVGAADKGNMECRGHEYIKGNVLCFKNCSCPSDYKYDSGNCSGNKKPAGAACDGKRLSCLCDTSLYPVSDCPEGFAPGGLACDDGSKHYQKCINLCDGLTDMDCGSFECLQTYAECPSKCQICRIDNCPNREDAETSFGCQKFWDDCVNKCEVPYPDNCHAREDNDNAQYGCQKNWADCSSKCEVPNNDNCAKRQDNATEYGCEKFWEDCPNKCETGTLCKPNDCSEYTLNTPPTNGQYKTCSPGCGDTTVYYKLEICNGGYVNLDNYWCNGALRCLWK